VTWSLFNVQQPKLYFVFTDISSLKINNSLRNYFVRNYVDFLHCYSDFQAFPAFICEWILYGLSCMERQARPYPAPILAVAGITLEEISPILSPLLFIFFMLTIYNHITVTRVTQYYIKMDVSAVPHNPTFSANISAPWLPAALLWSFIGSQYMRRSRAGFLFVFKFSCMLHSPAHFNTGLIPLNDLNYAISSVLF